MEITTSEKKLWGICLIAAPLLFAISTFFWNDETYGVAAATLIIFSMLFWIPAAAGFFSLLKDKMPGYASWGWLLIVYGSISGVCFAFLGYLTTIFNISHSLYLETLSKYPVSSQLLLFAAGPLFPLSILILSINLMRSKTIHLWIGICLCLGAIGFPLSRITRTQWIAHVVDVLWLIPCVYIGLSFLKKKQIASLVR